MPCYDPTTPSAQRTADDVVGSNRTSYRVFPLPDTLPLVN